jgi:hypothetical protein
VKYFGVSGNRPLGNAPDLALKRVSYGALKPCFSTDKQGCRLQKKSMEIIYLKTFTLKKERRSRC